MSQTRSKKERRFADIAGIFLFIILSPLLIAILVVHGLKGLILSLAVWLFYCARGRDILLVYSDSPIWHDYFENQILPKIRERAVILNWSHRSRWRRTLPVLAFRYFGGHTDFNPMAIVFRPFRFARKFRFYEPFRQFKHGKLDEVATMERELFALLDQIERS